MLTDEQLQLFAREAQKLRDEFFGPDPPRGAKVINQLLEERETLLKEVSDLKKKLDHIQGIFRRVEQAKGGPENYTNLCRDGA